jgi:hypothetical protein
MEELLDNYQLQYPPLSEFREAIDRSSLDEESREYLLELFFDENEDEK